RAALLIDGLVDILLRELVGVLLCADLCDVDDPTSHLEVAIWIVRILDRKGDARIASDVLVFHAPTRGIEAHICSVVVDPYGRGLRASVGRDRGEMRERLLVEEIEIL